MTDTTDTRTPAEKGADTKAANQAAAAAGAPGSPEPVLTGAQAGAKDDAGPVRVERVPNVNVAPITPDIDDDDPGINHNIVYG